MNQYQLITANNLFLLTIGIITFIGALFVYFIKPKK